MPPIMGAIAGSREVGCHPSPSQGAGMRVRGLSTPGGVLAPTALPSPGRLQKEVRLAQKADYSAERAASPLSYDKISVRHLHPSVWGVGPWWQARALLEGVPTGQGTPPSRAGGSPEPPPPRAVLSLQPGDKTLAQSAQMYHYQHQKQQMLSLEK